MQQHPFSRRSIFSVNPQKSTDLSMKKLCDQKEQNKVNYGIIQSYYTLSNKNNGVKLMFFFNISLSHLILD